MARKTANAWDKAELDADLAAIRLDIARTQIAATFDGVLDELMIEVGDVVDINETIGLIYDLDPVIVVASVGEREVGHICQSARNCDPQSACNLDPTHG